MEEYVVDGLAAVGEPPQGCAGAGSGGAVAAAESGRAGAGPAVLRAILLVRNAGRLVTLEDMEVLAVEESRGSAGSACSCRWITRPSASAGCRG